MVGTGQGGTYGGSSSFLRLPRVLRSTGGKRDEAAEEVGVAAFALPLLLPLGALELVR
jgi:hypothetical protein